MIDVEKVAKLARLKLTDEEKEEFSRDLNEILEAFEIIKNVDTEGVEPAYLPIDVEDVLREDEVKEPLGRILLELTEQKEKEYFRGPKIV